MKKVAIGLLCLSFLVVGCSDEHQIHVYGENEQENNTLKDTLNETKDIYEATAIFVEDELLVAIQVNPWIGFKEQKIEKKLQKKLKKQYPNLNVLVSTDFKLFWESNQLLEEENKENIAEKVKKLKDLAKEET